MSNRLNKEKEERLQPTRILYAIEKLEGLGFEIKYKDHSKVSFDFKGNTITLFPYSGWFSGKGVTDGRGIENLLKQLTK